MVGAPGYALRTDHGNPESTDYLINPFAQLDAHNSVSARIKEAENQAGVRLLYRAPRGVALTPAGECLLEHARSILNQMEHLKSDLRRYGDGAQGYVRVFANTTAVTEFMPEVLSEFLSKHPQVDVDLRERMTGEIVRGVLDGAADMGITSGPIDAAGIDLHHFSTDRLILALPPAHPLAGHASLRFEQVMEYDYIGLHESSTLQAFVNELMRNVRHRLHIRVQVSSFESVCRMVEAGVGVGIVPESAAKRHRQTMNIVFKTLDEDWATRKRYILTRSGDTLTGYALALIDSIMKLPQHRASRGEGSADDAAELDRVGAD